jgi:hypothetical protein
MPALFYMPNSRWHPAALDAYNERIAILMESPADPPLEIRKIAWTQAEEADRLAKTSQKELT